MILEERYLNLKPNHEKNLSEFYYLQGFIEKKSNLVKLKINNFSGDSKKILAWKSINGHVGFYKDSDGNVWGSYGSFVGGINKNGMYDKYLISFPNGETFEGEIGKDIVVLYNNNRYLSDLYLMNWYAEMLTQTDISLKANVKYARQIKLPIAPTDTVRKAINKAMEEGESGNTKAIVNDLFVNSMMNSDNSNTIPTLDLFSPQTAVYLQNLSRFHDELIIRAGLECGVCITARDKGAQLNENELNAFRAYATITIDDELEYLEQFKNDMKNVFDIDVEYEAKAFVQTNEELEEIEENESESDEDGNN